MSRFVCPLGGLRRFRSLRVGHRLVVALALIGTVGLTAAARNPQAFAGLLSDVDPLPPFRVVTPIDGAVVGDGNLLLIEGVATDRIDGVVDGVELAFDDDETWTSADRNQNDPSRWNYLWADPTPGTHRIRARALGVEGRGVVEQGITVQVADVWSTPFTIDNPYATAGSFRRGEIHVHSTMSFDGWNSLPPAQLALEYKRRGYQFLVITDHDVISYPSEVNDPTFITIPGYESTGNTGHITGVWVDSPVSPELPPQQRIDNITSQGGFAILNHPGWQVGWTGTDFKALRGYSAFEIYNGITSSDVRSGANTQLWHEVLNARGWPNRIWAVAVDDAHDVAAIGRGWIEVKTSRLTDSDVRRSLERGAFYASNGPSFGVLGVLKDAITASSPDAALIRFIDQNQRVLAEGPGSSASYRPKGSERWVRVEAVTPDGHMAWSQPFWLVPNAPTAALVPTWNGAALVGETLPGARVHVSEGSEYLGNVVANDQGSFTFSRRSLDSGNHVIRLSATAPWPDELSSPPTVVNAGSPGPPPQARRSD